MNTPLPERPHGLPRAALALLLCLMLAIVAPGCGPGVGGTGTGADEGTLAYFGARSASVCDTELAALLACPGAAGGPAPGSATGTAVRYFADSSSAARMHLRIEGNRAELDAPCARLQFSGEWGLVPGQAGRFYGGAVLAATPQPASLLATLAPGGLEFQVLGADERSLLPAQRLVPVPAPQAVACS